MGRATLGIYDLPSIFEKQLNGIHDEVKTKPGNCVYLESVTTKIETWMKKQEQFRSLWVTATQ